MPTRIVFILLSLFFAPLIYGQENKGWEQINYSTPYVNAALRGEQVHIVFIVGDIDVLMEALKEGAGMSRDGHGTSRLARNLRNIYSTELQRAAHQQNTENPNIIFLVDSSRNLPASVADQFQSFAEGKDSQKVFRVHSVNPQRGGSGFHTSNVIGLMESTIDGATYGLNILEGTPTSEKVFAEFGANAHVWGLEERATITIAEKGVNRLESTAIFREATRGPLGITPHEVRISILGDGVTFQAEGREIDGANTGSRKFGIDFKRTLVEAGNLAIEKGLSVLEGKELVEAGIGTFHNQAFKIDKGQGKLVMRPDAHIRASIVAVREVTTRIREATIRVKRK